MEASVSSEQQLRLAARAVNVTKEDGGLRWELALREARQHRAWKERWSCHVCRLCCLHGISIHGFVCCFLSYRYFMQQSEQHISGTRMFPRVRAYVIEPEPRARALCTRASDPNPSSLDSIWRWAIPCHSPNFLGHPRRIRVARLHSMNCYKQRRYTRYFSFLLSSLVLRSSTRRRFCPQRSSGQPLVTGVVPFPPWYVPSNFIGHRVQHSQCSSIFTECC